jgi:hypothetical protein
MQFSFYGSLFFGIAPAAVVPQSENRIWEFANVGYDAVAPLDVNCDGPEKLSSAYDVAPSRVQTDKARRTEAQRTSFALFGLFPMPQTQQLLQRPVLVSRLVVG